MSEGQRREDDGLGSLMFGAGDRVLSIIEYWQRFLRGIQVPDGIPDDQARRILAVEPVTNQRIEALMDYLLSLESDPIAYEAAVHSAELATIAALCIDMGFLRLLAAIEPSRQKGTNATARGRRARALLAETQRRELLELGRQVALDRDAGKLWKQIAAEHHTTESRAKRAARLWSKTGHQQSL